MSTAPVVLLHTDAPEAAREVVAAAHPDLPLHACDSYEALPEMLTRTGAEVVFSFASGARRAFHARLWSKPRA